MASHPEERIQAASRPAFLPDGLAYRSLPLQASTRIALELHLSLQEVELAALENGIVPERYVRNLNTYGLEQQARLLRSRAVVVGLGGLGGLVLELLARVGVGSLILVDGDRFEESNLNRQILCTLDQLGSRKVEVAADRVRQLNEAIAVRPEPCFLDAGNAFRLLADCDLAIDCLDSIAARRVLAQAARDRGIPLVTAAVAGTCGQLTIIMPGDESAAAIYGQDDALDRGAEATLGCLPQAVALLAALESAEALKLMLGQESALRGRLLLFDLDHALFQTVQLA